MPDPEHEDSAPTEPATIDGRPIAAPGDLSSLGELGVGAVIGDNYRIVGPLGQGAMGIVRLAVDVRLDRQVAIKLIHPSQVANETARERFRDETRTMAKVRHPNVVTIHASGDVHGIPYFVMEYVEGQDLQSWLEARGAPPLPIEDALEVMTAVCAGVTAIHEAGAIHGDLKPTNVLVGPGNQFVVTDLGLARFLGAVAEGQAAAVAGTPEYMAPEILSMRALRPDLAVRADVYSLGVMAFELLTGRPPFVANELVSLLNMHATIPPPPPSAHFPGLPAVFDEPILAALTKDPAMRTPSVEEFREALAEAAAEAARASGDMRFVVLDDDEDFRALVELHLQAAFPGCAVSSTGDPSAAIADLTERPASAAVVDLHLPGTNGLEVVAAVRAAEQGHRTPIIVVTAVGGARDWKVLQALGADAFLAKPLDPPDLIRVVTRATGRSLSVPPR